MLTFQLLGKDDASFDDVDVYTGRWQAYIDSFVSVSCSVQIDEEVIDRKPRMRQQEASPMSKSSPPSYLGEQFLIAFCR